MPVLETQNFGRISFAEGSIFEFPRGLPGFEERRRFVPVQTPHAAPIVFLQSLEDPELCFTTLPIRVVDPQYSLEMDEPDVELLGWPPDYRPRIGEDVLCLAVLSLRETGSTANLLAPVVVNLSNRIAVQAVAAASPYSHQQPLFPAEAPTC